MNIILLSGGSGKRLWPLSNDVRSKQFIKLFKNEKGEYESMVQRVYRQITKVDPEAKVTIATSKSQASAIKNQLGENVSICVEPCRRDTFPAIALAANYLHDVLDVKEDEPVVVCPVDPYVEDTYYEAVKELAELAQAGNAGLTLMGIEPTYPSGGVNEHKLQEMGIKHYIIPDISEKNPRSIVKTIITIKKIVDKENITLVHSHHRMAALYAELICGKSILKIANAHNTFHDKKTLTRLAYRNTKLIAVGEMVKKNLVEYYGIPNEQVTVIHNAIKPFDGKISPIPLLTEYRENGYKIIGNVGRLSEQKGMEYFINAVPGVIEKFPK